jgi:hypothetical protein
MDTTLHAAAAEKIREYRADYNNRSSNSISFESTVATTSDRFHCELVRILFSQTHRETDRFFAASGVASKSNTHFSF